MSKKSEARKKVSSGVKAVEFLLLHGKKKWKTHELQTQAQVQFGKFMSESTVSRYCRLFCAPAIPPVNGISVRAYTYIHKDRI